jgi:hypothetical protein
MYKCWFVRCSECKSQGEKWFDRFCSYWWYVDNDGNNWWNDDGISFCVCKLFVSCPGWQRNKDRRLLVARGGWFSDSILFDCSYRVRLFI